jgi:small subunit ribosomal protein S17
MDKSISVAVERLVKHPVYGRYIRRTTKLMAHDEEQTCQVGDIVRVVETRPTSKLKCWRFVDVVRRAE